VQQQILPFSGFLLSVLYYLMYIIFNIKSDNREA